jgi:hypothetical protein
MRLFIAWVALVALVAPGAVGLEAALQEKWTVLKQWSGEPGSTDTERFTTTSESFRISWKSDDRGRGGVLDIYVRDGDGRLVKAGVSLQASDPTKERGSGSGAFTISSKPGPHYLEIRSTGKDWQIAVEQPAG